jgi:hypothetical protein
MDATSNFSLSFAQASESKARMPERLLKRQALERFATGLNLISAIRLSADLRSLSLSGVQESAYHESKGIEPLAGAPVRNGDVLVGEHKNAGANRILATIDPWLDTSDSQRIGD